MPSGKRGRIDLSIPSIDRSATLSFVAAGNYDDVDDDVLLFSVISPRESEIVWTKSVQRHRPRFTCG